MFALVTGAGGFLGQYHRRAIARPRRSRASLARGDYPELAAAGRRVRARPTCATRAAASAACAGVDVVFHAAGVAGIWGPWEHYYGINCRRHAKRHRRLPSRTACRAWSTPAAPA